MFFLSTVAVAAAMSIMHSFYHNAQVDLGAHGAPIKTASDKEAPQLEKDSPQPERDEEAGSKKTRMNHNLVRMQARTFVRIKKIPTNLLNVRTELNCWRPSLHNKRSAEGFGNWPRSRGCVWMEGFQHSMYSFVMP